MTKLSDKQHAAIEIMSQPQRGGMTYEQIADEVGVARSTLYEWKKNEAFTNELKREIVRKTADRLPDVMDAIIDNIIETGNAAAFRTLLQANGMLSEKIEVDTKESQSVDIAALKARMDAMTRGDLSD